MKAMYNNKVVGEVITNHNMTDEEALEFCLGLSSINNQEELEKLYSNGKEYVYYGDNGEYELDTENFTFKY